MLLMKFTNSKKFWEIFDEIKISNDKKARENLPKRLIKPDGSLTQSSEEAMQTWVEHFKTLHNPSRVSLEDSKHIFSCEGTVNDKSDDIILNSPITTEEVHNAINSLEEHKAPGFRQSVS